MKKQLPLLMFLAMISFSLLRPGLCYGQKTDADAIPVYNIQAFLAEKLSSSSEAGGVSANLSQLAFESNPTLVISNGKFSLWGGDVPVVAAVDVASLEYLFKEDPGFEQIQLIRIIMDQTDFDLKLDLLDHFKNLKYVFFVASFDLCPESPGNIACETGMVKDLFSGSAGQNDLMVFYQVVHHQ